MQVHYYKTTWGKAWQKHNQKKYGYNPKYKEVKPLNKPKKRANKKNTTLQTKPPRLIKQENIKMVGKGRHKYYEEVIGG